MSAKSKWLQHGMYPGVAVGKSRPWIYPLAFSSLGLYIGFIIGIATENLLFTLIACFVGGLLSGAYYTRAGTVYYRLAVLQRSLGSNHFRFDISMEWPIDGLMQFVVDRLTARGFKMFPLAPQFVAIPGEALARLRYGYVIGPINRQLLVLQTMDTSPGPFSTQAKMKMCYFIVVRPFERRTPPHEDPVVRTVGQLLWEFERLRWRKGYPPTLPARRLGSR